MRGCVQAVAYAVAVTVHEIEHAGRHACENKTRLKQESGCNLRGATCVVHNLCEDHGGERRLLRRFQHAGAAGKQGGYDFQSNLFHSFNHRDSSWGFDNCGWCGYVHIKTTLNPESKPNLIHGPIPRRDKTHNANGLQRDALRRRVRA